MEVVIKFDKKNLQKVKEILLKDEEVSKASIVFKEGSLIGEEDHSYCYISGLESYCKRALELTKDLAEDISEEERSKLIEKIKEEEERANEGFGAIFG